MYLLCSWNLNVRASQLSITVKQNDSGKKYSGTPRLN